MPILDSAQVYAALRDGALLKLPFSPQTTDTDSNVEIPDSLIDVITFDTVIISQTWLSTAVHAMLLHPNLEVSWFQFPKMLPCVCVYHPKNKRCAWFNIDEYTALKQLKQEGILHG